MFIESGGKEYFFFFDGAYLSDVKVKNEQIYKERCELYLQRVMEGFNVSIIAMGVINVGKIYFMFGIDSDLGIVFCFIRNFY